MHPSIREIIRIFLVVGLILLGILWLLTSKKDSKNPKITAEALSSYRLQEWKFFNSKEERFRTFINIQVALAYPLNDFRTEKEIIQKKEKINSFIKTYLSEKSYNALDQAKDREALKTELLVKINQNMKHKIKDIYYIKFTVLKQKAENY